MPPKPDLSFSEEFVNEPIDSESTVKKPEVETSEVETSADKPKDVRKNNGAPIIEEWVSDSEDEAESKPKIEKKTIKPSFAKIEFVKSKKQQDLEEKGVINSGCSRHMTGNMSYLIDFEEIDEGYVAFGGNPKGGKITRKVPRKDNMYSDDLNNIVPKGGLTCLFAKATSNESKLWYKRLGHINFKTMNKLVKGNLSKDVENTNAEINALAEITEAEERAARRNVAERVGVLRGELLHFNDPEDLDVYGKLNLNMPTYYSTVQGFKKVQSSVTSSGDETSSGIISDEEIDKQGLEAHYGFMAKIQENVFANERQHSKKNSAECTDERVALANLIANLTLDTEENKTILKQLKKANASLTQELEKCKTNLDETNSALGEAISCRDSCLIALQNKQNEFEKYKAFNDRIYDYDILQTKLNENSFKRENPPPLNFRFLKDIEIKEGLKTKAYEISVLNQKHDELVKKSLLTRSQLEGYLKENTTGQSFDLKVKEEKDIDKMIEMDKQLKFLNEIVYTRNQSIQTIHMLAPKCSTYNGRPTFANPRLPNTCCCKPKPRNWQASMTSRVSNKDVHLDEHRKQKPFLKFYDLQCPTCKKCLYTANHDECVLEYLSKLNHHASAQNTDVKSHNTTKRYVPVEKDNESKKPEN
ncbi:ribonuclease H-like domain-containing protein [Tanacetum coccineum]